MKLSSIANYLGIKGFNQPTIDPPVNPNFDLEKAGPRKVLLSWEGLARPEKKWFTQKFIRTALVVLVIVGLLLVLMQEFFLIIVIASVIFFVYALSHASPEIIKYEISTHGVTYNGRIYYWNDLKYFFFSISTSPEVLVIDTKEPLPGRIFLTFKPEQKEQLKELLLQYLTYLDQEPQTFLDKAYKNIADKFSF